MEREDFEAADLSRDHQSALEVLRYAKNAFLCMALAAVVLHVFAYGVVRFTDRLEPLRGGSIFSVQTDPRAEPVVYTQAQREAARRWQQGLEPGLMIAGFVGRAAVLILAGLFVICLLVSLTARLGGAAALAKTCVWTLAALAMLTPWVHVPAGAGVGSAFYAFDELSEQASRSAGEGLFASVRYLLCPLLVAAFLVAAHVHYRAAFRQITRRGAGLLPIHEV